MRRGTLRRPWAFGILLTRQPLDISIVEMQRRRERLMALRDALAGIAVGAIILAMLIFIQDDFDSGDDLTPPTSNPPHVAASKYGN